MRGDIVSIADKIIPQPQGIERIQERYVTGDIIQQVLLQFGKRKDQLKAFAPYLKGATVYDTCYNVWKFWRGNIKYHADDAGDLKQLVKSPAAVWKDKFCDCKSFALVAAVCCHHLGIKCVFRFVSFNPAAKSIPTHVYVVAFHRGKEIVIDCCLPTFDQEKYPNPIQGKFDYLPEKNNSISGVFF